MAVPGAASSDRRGRRRNRRRRQDKPPVSARLVLDDQIRGDVGVVSEDLFNELFPHGDSPIGTYTLAAKLAC